MSAIKGSASGVVDAARTAHLVVVPHLHAQQPALHLHQVHEAIAVHIAEAVRAAAAVVDGNFEKPGAAEELNQTERGE